MNGCVCVNIIGYLLVITGVVVSLEGLQADTEYKISPF